MATTLANRAELRAAFYRLTATSASDGALTEHDVSAGDNVNGLILAGMRDAQLFLLSAGGQPRWKTTSTTLSFSGTEAADGGRYTDLPADFLRLFGDDQNSALRTPDGDRWGRLIPIELRNARMSDLYWIENDRLWIARGANPPNNLVADYVYRVPELTDDVTAPDFPLDDRPLIVAYAAARFVEHPTYPGRDDLRARVLNYLRELERHAATRARRTREPRRMKSRRSTGSHWFI